VGKLAAMTSEINRSEVIGPAGAWSRGGVRARIVVKIA
jgi:hypothetical protein